MVNINTGYYDFLFTALKSYMAQYSLYAPRVLKKPILSEPLYPQVVLTEISNTNDSMTLDRRQVVDRLGFEVDIFSTNLVVGDKTIDNLVICRELAGIADTLLYMHGFRRLSLTPTPTIDTTLYRIVGRYTGRVFNNFNQIF